MARFSLGGDEDDNQRRRNPSSSSNQPQPAHKRARIRIRSPNPRFTTSANATASASAGDAVASTSNSGNRRSAVNSTPVNVEHGEFEDEGEVEFVNMLVNGLNQGVESANQQNDHLVNLVEEGLHTYFFGVTHSLSSESGEDLVEEVEVQPGEAQVSANSAQSGIGVTLMEPDVLDCPICYEALSPPVYQCENGHLACEACCPKIRNKCPLCCLPIGYNRCRAMEKVLESIKVSCHNMEHGCMEKISYSAKSDHEKTCNYAPCSCPHSGCEYVAMSKSLYTHFVTKHVNASKEFRFNLPIFIRLDSSQKHVILHEPIESTLFVVNHSVEPFGSLVNIVCVSPTPKKDNIFCDLTATVGETYVNFISGVERMQKWIEEPPKEKYLIVPNYYASSGGHFDLKIIIHSKSFV